jgi:protoheme ferro-lyase
MNYDAILLVSFGGPERNEDVLPFLENRWLRYALFQIT